MKYKVGDIIKLSTGEKGTITKAWGRYSATIGDDNYDEYNFDEKEIIGLWGECKSTEQVSKLEGKYKLIDVLNKIANGELKEGAKVIYKNNVFDWDGNVLIDGKNKTFFGTIKSELNEEVELIEPNQFREDTKMIEPTDNTKIEELDVVQCEPMLYNSHAIMGMIIENRNKLNEVIRKLNKENNNE